MHISEGVLTLPVLSAGYALTITGVALGLRKINAENLPKVAVLAAVFFVASFMHINVGPSSVHFMLNGLIGIILGWAAFPVIFVGLLIQGILFQYGGLTTLGINTFNVAGPAVLFGLLFKHMIITGNPLKSNIAAFSTGFLALGLSAVLICITLLIVDPVQFKTVGYTVLAAHIPVMFIEGFLALACVRFIKKVKPDLFDPLLSN